MKILYYWNGKQLVPGIVTTNGVIDVARQLQKINKTLDHPQLHKEDLLLLESQGQQIYSSDDLLNEADLAPGPCAPYPQKIICIGLNYRKHALESGMAVPDCPVAFTKYNNALTSYGSDVSLGREGEQFDYEVELGVVIGKKCKDVSKEDALDYVLGYCTANDLSCRDLQFKTSQWLLGKSLDQFLPLGKYLVTADEITDPQQLTLKCFLNGELRQHSNTSDMIFSVAEIISFLSRYMTLVPGDLILTGTPEGVIMGLPEKKWLVPGDVVRVEIEGLGYTENRMVE